MKLITCILDRFPFANIIIIHSGNNCIFISKEVPTGELKWTEGKI